MNTDNYTEEEKRFLKEKCIELAQRMALTELRFAMLIDTIEDEELREKMKKMQADGPCRVFEILK